jgi:streptogramin lyase
MFTDVVGSTDLARELGDQRWARLLEVHRRIIRQELRANRGREIDTAGDGFFAVFESPADAVRCAFVAARKVQDLGLDIRAGVHFGEVERSGAHTHGIVVHTGARVMSLAGPAEVLITQTVKDLVAGARFGIAERGVVELKGVPGRWTIFNVLQVDGQLRPEPVEDATVASERRERASAAPPRRAGKRWIVPAAIAGVLAIAVATLLVLRPAPTYVPAGGTVARIDGDRFERPIEVGSHPVALIEGFGRVWVMDGGAQLYWVDERTGSIGSLGTQGVPTGAAVGEDALWITTGFGNAAGPDATVSRFDPAGDQPSAAFHVPIDSTAITSGGGFVWVASVNTASVTRYDPVTHSIRSIALPGSARPNSIAFGTLGGDAVWVGDELSGNVYRVEASGVNAVKTFSVEAPPSAIAIGPEAVWVASGSADAVYALDADFGAVRTSVDVGGAGCNTPTSIAVGAEGVWVACAVSNRVIMVDLDRGAVTTTLAVQDDPIAVASASDGSVWVAVQSR